MARKLVHSCVVVLTMLSRIIFVVVLVFPARQAYRGPETKARIHLQADWAYFLHIYLNLQCLLLAMQTALCLHQVLRRFLASRPTRSGPSGKSLDPTGNSPNTDTSKDPQVIIIVPSYHEDPKTLESTLNAVVASEYPRPRLHIHLSFDGLGQIEEIGSVKKFLGLASFGRDGAHESTYETNFRGCRLTLSVFRHGGKRHCQKRTFEQIKLHGSMPSLSTSLIMLLDSDTFLHHDCIREFVSTMRCRLATGTKNHALSGVTRVFRSRHSLLLLVQQLDYFYSQHFEREAEAACGAVHCLPGGLTMLTYGMLEVVAEKYFKNTDVASDLFDYMKKYLGEDRWLTQLAIEQDQGRGGVGFCVTSFCETMTPSTIPSFFGQRKRWFLGCIANDVSGMSDPGSWTYYPALSTFRLVKYAVGTPGFPFVLTSLNVLYDTPYFRPNLKIWAVTVAITWFTLIIVASSNDLSSALLFPFFFVLNPVQLAITRIYAILTIGHRTWGARTAPIIPEASRGCLTKKKVAATRSLNPSDTTSLVSELKSYLGQSHSNCASQVMTVLGTGSQVGRVTYVLFDGIAVARKRASSRTSTAGQAVLQEIRVLSRLSHVHIISVVKAQELSLKPEVFLWPVAPCDLMVFLSYLHAGDSGEPMDHAIWQTLGLSSTTSTATGLLNARKWLSESIGCLCNSVAYIHGEGIWHHDLRTQNILVTRRGPVLADFGASVDFGKPKSPSEGFGNKHMTGFAADVLLLGCILLEISSAVVGIDPHANEDLDVMKDLGRTYEWNFVRNSGRRTNWIKAMRRCSDSMVIEVLGVVEQMLHDAPFERPSASSVVQKFSASSISSVLFGECCAYEARQNE